MTDLTWTSGTPLEGGAPTYLTARALTLPPGFQYPTQAQVSAIVDAIIGGDDAVTAATAEYGTDATGFPQIEVTMIASPKDSSHALNGLANGVSATDFVNDMPVGKAYFIPAAPIPGETQWVFQSGSTIAILAGLQTVWVQP
jgi:hypothetical protein